MSIESPMPQQDRFQWTPEQRQILEDGKKDVSFQRGRQALSQFVDAASAVYFGKEGHTIIPKSQSPELDRSRVLVDEFKRTVMRHEKSDAVKIRVSGADIISFAVAMHDAQNVWDNTMSIRPHNVAISASTVDRNQAIVFIAQLGRDYVGRVTDPKSRRILPSFSFRHR